MARPQVAAGGTASNTEASCKYIEFAVADSRQEVVIQLGVGQGAKNSSLLKLALLPNGCMFPGSTLILWYNLSNDKGI
jgi:hypothetical protein